MNEAPRATLLERLEACVSGKTYSFVDYIVNASPYIAERFAPLWELLLQLRKEEREHARMLSRLVVKMGGVPNPRIFDESAADLNYLRIEYLAKLLIQAKEKAIGELEKTIELCAGAPEAREVLLELLAAEQQQLVRIRETLASCERNGSLPQPSSNES